MVSGFINNDSEKGGQVKIKRIIGLGLSVVMGIVTARASQVDISMVNSTTSNHNSGHESAGSGVHRLSAASLSFDDLVSSSATVEGRAYGHVSSQSTDGYITQWVNVKSIYTVTAGVGIEYSIAFNPKFHGQINIREKGNAYGNNVNLSALTGSINGTTVSALGMSGAYVDGPTGSWAIDRSAAYTLSNQTGANTYELTYTFSITANSEDWNFLNFNDSQDALLWGQNGSLGDTIDDYSSTSARDADGLFLPATITITAIPEPVSGTLVAVFGGVLLLIRRRFAN